MQMNLNIMLIVMRSIFLSVLTISVFYFLCIARLNHNFEFKKHRFSILIFFFFVVFFASADLFIIVATEYDLNSLILEENISIKIVSRLQTLVIHASIVLFKSTDDIFTSFSKTGQVNDRIVMFQKHEKEERESEQFVPRTPNQIKRKSTVKRLFSFALNGTSKENIETEESQEQSMTAE